MSSRPSRGAARLAAILDALPDALLLVNHNGTVVNANSIALEVLESPGTGLVGRGLLDLLPEFDSERIPGSLRRRDEDESAARTKPTRMTARRTDGTEFPAEVTSANISDGRMPYASSFEAAWADHGEPRESSASRDGLLMLVVRDLSGTLDAETELARQQRQTEMILRAATEGVVGVDGEGTVVLVNPAAAQILGHRAGDLGGRAIFPLVHHSRPDGTPLAPEDTPLSDTLRSGRKHRVRAGQVLWTKDGSAVPVDMTTAPVRDGDRLVGAVMTFTDRRPYDALAARQEQLTAVLDEALRTPLERLRSDLANLAADPAGQLWPEANQVLHHLSAGYARMTALVDNVLAYQRLAGGGEKLQRARVPVDAVVQAGVEGAVELIGPGRAQFAVHAQPLDVDVDAQRLAAALAHLIADVAGVDATGSAPALAPGVDPTIVVAAVRRGDVVRIEVRGPHPGGSPVHQPLVRGVVERHGGVLQAHPVPGASGGSAYVLEVPAAPESGAGGTPTPGTGVEVFGARETAAPASGAGRTRNETTFMPVPPEPPRGTAAGLEPVRAQGTAAEQAPETETGAHRRLYVAEDHRPDMQGAPDVPGVPAGSTGGGTAHGRVRDDVAEQRGVRSGANSGSSGTDEATGAHQRVPEPPEFAAPDTRGGRAPVPATGLPAGAPGWGTEGTDGAGVGVHGSGQVPAQRDPDEGTEGTEDGDRRAARRTLTAPAPDAQAPAPAIPEQVQPGTGRRGRRAAPASEQQDPGRVQDQEQQGTPPGSANVPAVPEGGGRRARRLAAARARAAEQAAGVASSGEPFALEPVPAAGQAQVQDVPEPRQAPEPEPQHSSGPEPRQEPQREPEPETGAEPEPAPVLPSRVAASPILGGGPLPEQPARHGPRMPGTPPPPYDAARAGTLHGGTTSARVRTLGQGMPAAAPTPIPTPPGQPQTGPGRRRKLAAPPAEDGSAATSGAQASGAQPPAVPTPPPSARRATPPSPRPSAPAPAPAAREFTVHAPDAALAEGPEPLDGPGGAVEVGDGAGLRVPPQPRDDELPPEPLDNPRRLLVWPEPDEATTAALTERGYRPVIVRSREEVDAQIASYPAALFVDPLTGPITRTALQSLRAAALAAEVPVLVTAGLGVATREAAYGADPAILLKALAPHEGEQAPARVLLVEEQEELAAALVATLERRGMRVGHARTDADAVTLAEELRPSLVVMDLLQVRRRRAGLIDWLRVNGVLSRTPFVVYTSADTDPSHLPKLASGEHVLFLAERSTSEQVQTRIVDLLTKIGAQ